MRPAVTLVAREPGPQAAWDWLAVVADLRLGGMAKMLADHCELVSQAGDAVTLRVGEAHKHLLDRTYQDKLVAALRDKYGATLNVTLRDRRRRRADAAAGAYAHQGSAPGRGRGRHRIGSIRA